MGTQVEEKAGAGSGWEEHTIPICLYNPMIL